VGAASYTWTGGITNGTAFAPTTTTTYTVTGTDANGCVNTASKIILVNSLPNVTATSTPTNGTICVGANATLTGVGAASYTWTGGITNGTGFTPTTTTTYTVTGTDANGCVNTVSKTITVNALPAVSATSTPTNATICVGSNATLNGAGANSYTWTGGITNGTAFAPTTTTTYTVTGTDANGCVNTANKTVIVNNLPNVTAITTPSIGRVCFGGNATLSGAGATTYTWTGGITNGIAFAPTTTTTYTVTGTDANGCMNTTTKTILVNSLPTITVISTPTNGAICVGANATLSGAGASSYTWSGGITNGMAFAPRTTTTYTVSGTDANGCLNTASKTITVNSLPIVTATSIPNSGAICLGDNATLNGGGASSYTWSGGVANGISFAPKTTTTYTVIGTDANGCVNTAIKTITINSTPLAPIVSDVAYCYGSMASPLIATASSGNTLLWYGLNATGGVSATIAPTPSTLSLGNIYYYVSQKNGISCESSRTKITVTINPIPSKPIISRGVNNALFSSSTDGNIWYQEGFLTIYKSQSINPLFQGAYSVKVTLNGCTSAISDPYFYLVTDILDINKNNYIKVSPNPFFGNINIDFNKSQFLNLEIFSISTGTKVLSMKKIVPSQNIDLNSLLPGLYLFIFSDLTTSQHQKLKLIKL